MVEVGKTVSWVSQSQGSQKRKTGKVVAIVKMKKSAYDLIPKTAKKSHVKFSNNFDFHRERVLVAVPAGVNGDITHYYCPALTTLIMQGN